LTRTLRNSNYSVQKTPLTLVETLILKTGAQRKTTVLEDPTVYLEWAETVTLSGESISLYKVLE
jgi:hypothetical protein